MKRLKLLSLFLVMASLLSLSSISTIASDVPVTATISGYVSLVFSPDYSGVDFGTIAQGSSNNAGQDNTLYYINITTNGNATVTWSQTDLTSGGNTLPKANVKMTKAVNTSASTNPADAVSLSSDIQQTNIHNSNRVYANYWLDVPVLQASGIYTGEQTITATAV